MSTVVGFAVQLCAILLSLTSMIQASPGLGTALDTRDTVDAFKLYAYGTNITGLPVTCVKGTNRFEAESADEVEFRAYLAPSATSSNNSTQYGNSSFYFNTTEDSTVLYAECDDDDGYNLHTLINTADDAFDHVLFLSEPEDGDVDWPANWTMHGFGLYGTDLFNNNKTGFNEMKFWAIPTKEEGVYKLTWNEALLNNGTGTPVSLQTKAPVTPVATPAAST